MKQKLVCLLQMTWKTVEIKQCKNQCKFVMLKANQFPRQVQISVEISCFTLQSIFPPEYISSIWLVVLGLTALSDSISVYIRPSPKEREKE